jgi:hypothetical protein
MEIDKKEYKELLLWLWGMVERARTELIAWQVAVIFMNAAGDGHTFDQFLEQARQHPSPRLLADHQEVRDTIESLLAEEKSADLLNFLRKWKPRGPVQ